MKKNIMVVFGLDSPRNNYLKKLYDEKIARDGNVYITIDILSSSLGLDLSSNNILSAINHFTRNKNEMFKSLYLSNALMAEKNFYAAMWSFNHEAKNDSYSITQDQEKTLIGFIEPNSIHYLLNSWGDFLGRNINKISIHDTLTRRSNNKDKVGNEKVYSNYKAGFLAKNIPFAYVNKHVNEGKMIKSGQYHTSSALTHSNLINTIKDKNYTHNAFESYLRSDEEGIDNLLRLKQEIGEPGSYYDNFENYEKKYHGEIITRSFAKSYWRKLSKLAVDWVEAEAGNPNSPIKGLVFYMEDDNRFKRYKEKSNIDEKKFHHHWRDCDYKNIGSLDYRSAIAHSELRHAKRLMNSNANHHIKLVYINDKDVLNRIKMFLNEQ
ncbi:hypothetical protein Xmau_00713 [Xenorhabdus mauleonii]|uniref:Uncharacterized protein n=1 Tax=Xenorhabdus mauleonii TaxID=351675 RepID=A0A1I3X552_9GAMM|nr:hypothetical protein [Xenorhabdus mauleonii]PHM46303.1 hypothetical protein Xmau_00713 [Xenorhabdus mauleonii]SFK14755.1 hypothetical protein SAMN05421680_1323 [Xenorhabdus mauleonii]